jgi:hypothetical protein
MQLLNVASHPFWWSICNIYVTLNWKSQFTQTAYWVNRRTNFQLLNGSTCETGYSSLRQCITFSWNVARYDFKVLKPTGYGMHQQVEYFNNCRLCPYCIDVFCICLRTNSDLCHLHKKLIVFITEMKSVYSAVRTGPLNEAVCAPSFKG